MVLSAAELSVLVVAELAGPLEVGFDGTGVDTDEA
jgi:hypothetical protein